MDTTSKNLISESLLRHITKLYYDDDIVWWCWQYDFIKNEPLTAKTSLQPNNHDDGVLPKYGFVCLDNKQIVNVIDLVKAYDRNQKIKNILE